MRKPMHAALLAAFLVAGCSTAAFAADDDAKPSKDAKADDFHLPARSSESSRPG
jgi:Spy/CpxP family protein refolding chaperone